MLGASRTSFKTGHQGAAVSTETMLRLAHPLAYMVKENKWLPKRSIAFNFWGGKEFGNIGITEFMEARFIGNLMLNLLILTVVIHMWEWSFIQITMGMS